MALVPEVSSWHKRLWLIDHGAALYAQHGPEPLATHARRPFAAIADHVLLNRASSIADADGRLADLVSPEVIAAVASQSRWRGPPSPRAPTPTICRPAMDQDAEQKVDVHAGLESTLTILAHKLDKGTVKVVRDYDRELPRITAHGSELNQVWTNLLDTPSTPWTGHVDGHYAEESQRRRRGRDRRHRAGIAEEIRSRVFDPFFTTKDVGEGTGLGLESARRIVVDRHRGTLVLDSDASGTRARVRLPGSG